MIPAGTLAPFPPERRTAVAGWVLPAGWSCRALHAGDLAWLAALYASTREDELRAVPWPEAVKRQFLDQQFVAQHQHYLGVHPDAHYLAIEHAGQPVGRLYLDDHGADDRIVDISLLPAWRGVGLGTALFGQLQQAAAARDRGLHLHVMVHNTGARRLYARLGFIAAAIAPGELHLPMHWSPTQAAAQAGLS